ncbi:hypothetical protein Nepgr_017265 [Nepenthes gracilis]|uniref:Uncharacterized protein n=1 Tax=Nepenthes gracilis TaxID=150966 RepID=A0AAD3SR54_NEPGR|nr:hypothetical protein Nepgr_017265 [Nepenthes gracilis]
MCGGGVWDLGLQEWMLGNPFSSVQAADLATTNVSNIFADGMRETFCMKSSSLDNLYSNGIWYKENPLLKDVPITMLQLIFFFVLSNAFHYILRPLIQSTFVCNTLGQFISGLLEKISRFSAQPSTGTASGSVKLVAGSGATWPKAIPILSMNVLNGIENLLEERNAVDNRGYWDLVWRDLGFTGTAGTYDRIKGTSFRIIVEKEKQEELSLTREWDPSLKGKLRPLNIHKRFIMLQGSSGFYSYAICELLPGNEFRSGGPVKQIPTTHVGPTNLAMFFSAHYAGTDMVTGIADDEAWKKGFGPVFMFVNCVPKKVDWHWLWKDAKEQELDEKDKQPYWFIASEDFPSFDNRGIVCGEFPSHKTIDLSSGSLAEENPILF